MCRSSAFDGQPQAYWESYRLVTIRQPLEAMVEAAADMLLARVENPELGARSACSPASS
jgi:DNA-binding LacI/PurR family transcriptional regulator